jgi:hypothetical protein
MTPFSSDRPARWCINALPAEDRFAVMSGTK